MYTDKYFPQLNVGTEQVLTSLATIAAVCMPMGGKIRSISFTISTLTSSSADAVVTVYVRNALGVTGSQVTVGTINIPTATAVGKTLYKHITPVAVLPGQTVEFVVSTVATSAGKGFCNASVDYDPEYVANLSNYIAST